MNIGVRPSVGVTSCCKNPSIPQTSGRIHHQVQVGSDLFHREELEIDLPKEIRAAG